MWSENQKWILYSILLSLSCDIWYVWYGIYNSDLIFLLYDEFIEMYKKKIIYTAIPMLL